MRLSKIASASAELIGLACARLTLTGPAGFSAWILNSSAESENEILLRTGFSGFWPEVPGSPLVAFGGGVCTTLSDLASGLLPRGFLMVTLPSLTVALALTRTGGASGSPAMTVYAPRARSTCCCANTHTCRKVNELKQTQ